MARQRQSTPGLVVAFTLLGACSSDAGGATVTSSSTSTAAASATTSATATSTTPPTPAASTATGSTTVPATTVPATAMPATAVPATAVPAPTTIRIVSQNILHGQNCPTESGGCQLTDRIAVFIQQLADAGCPEIVAIQEANAEVAALFGEHLEPCGYTLVWDGDPGPDRELVLTTQHAIETRRVALVGGERDAFVTRLDTQVGAIELFTTHLASGRDNGPCDACPPPCDPAGELRECQARQVLDAVGQSATSDIVVVAGDFNATPGEPTHQLVVDAGLVASHLVAGRPECGPDHPLMCTAGRDDRSMADMTDPGSRQTGRIDYIFVGADRCQIGDATGPFNAEPAQGAIAYPSDHTGIMTELVCSNGL